MIEALTNPDIWLSFLMLAALEIVLGIDNLIFISIAVNRLPETQRQGARILGLTIALGLRIVLLLSLSWIMSLTRPLVTLFDFTLSIRDLILFIGGLFLIAKATIEIHSLVEGEPGHTLHSPVQAGLLSVVTQIVLLDIVFSFDSVLTALGLTHHVPVIVAAIVTAMLVMVFLARPVGDFVEKHLSIKMLALAFLILIGVVLVMDGFHVDVPKPYIYSAMAFSMFVQGLTMVAARRRRIEI